MEKGERNRFSVGKEKKNISKDLPFIGDWFMVNDRPQLHLRHPIDVYFDNECSLIVDVAACGARKEDFQITVSPQLDCTILYVKRCQKSLVPASPVDTTSAFPVCSKISYKDFEQGFRVDHAFNFEQVTVTIDLGVLRVKVPHRPHPGLAPSRDLPIEECKGELVQAVVDAREPVLVMHQ